MSTPDTAATPPVRLSEVRFDWVTEEPMPWSGVGRPKTYANETAGDLDRFIGYVDDRVESLLSGRGKYKTDAAAAFGATHLNGALGHFQSEETAKRVAYRLNRIRNRIFNACRAHQAAERRRAAQGSADGPDETSCQKVEASR